MRFLNRPYPIPGNMQPSNHSQMGFFRDPRGDAANGREIRDIALQHSPGIADAPPVTFCPGHCDLMTSDHSAVHMERRLRSLEFQTTGRPFTPFPPHATGTLTPPDRNIFPFSLIVASPARCVFRQIFHPAERIGYGLCILRPDRADIRRSDSNPMIENEIGVLRGVPIIREICHAVKVRHPSPLPLSDPM